MTDFNPQIVRIEKVEKHPNADNLSIYTVLNDYPVVDRTGRYNVGDLATYICIDAIVPDIEKYHFLSPKQYERYEENGETKQRVIGIKYPVGSVPEKYRIIKAKKFLGVYSQGFLEPAVPNLNVGDSVIEALGLKKWEEQEEDNIKSKKNLGSNAEKAPKGWSIPYYDIQSIRNNLSCIIPKEEIVLLEKLHGSNAGFCHDGEKLHVKSRNFYKKRHEDDMWWDAALRYSLEEKLAKFPMMVFFAECIGKIKNFRYDTEIVNGEVQTKLYFFDVWDVKNERYLDYDDSVRMIKEAGLDPTPELYRGLWIDKEAMYAYSEGKTNLGGKHIREGWVLKPIKERYEPKLDSRWQAKLVSETYNLQK